MTDNLTWRKSSHSGGSTNECVEVAATPAAVYLRDTQNRHLGTLELDPAAFTALIQGVRGDRL